VILRAIASYQATAQSGSIETGAKRVHPLGRLRRLLRRRILLRHRLTRLRRILRRLIRLLVRGRLEWLLDRSLYLIPGRMQFLVKVFSRFTKFVHALSEAPRQFRKLFSAKQDQHYYQN
jgi:hypothetical protein